jgi:hypothetical protein
MLSPIRVSELDTCALREIRILSWIRTLVHGFKKYSSFSLWHAGISYPDIYLDRDSMANRTATNAVSLNASKYDSAGFTDIIRIDEWWPMADVCCGDVQLLQSCFEIIEAQTKTNLALDSDAPRSRSCIPTFLLPAHSLNPIYYKHSVIRAKTKPPSKEILCR